MNLKDSFFLFSDQSFMHMHGSVEFFTEDEQAKVEKFC